MLTLRKGTVAYPDELMRVVLPVCTGAYVKIRGAGVSPGSCYLTSDTHRDWQVPTFIILNYTCNKTEILHCGI